uniref:Uncharacterized protein n=1 Tax=Arundo donax TaxID=35708 RepID=A0A0A9HR36_ARUDO
MLFIYFLSYFFLVIFFLQSEMMYVCGCVLISIMKHFLFADTV